MILFDYYKVKLKVLNGKETPRNGWNIAAEWSYVKISNDKILRAIRESRLTIFYALISRISKGKFSPILISLTKKISLSTSN